MTQFEAHEESVEVNGQTVLAFLDGVPSAFEDKTASILENHGIEDPHPDEWYPQQAWLDAFKEIADTVGKNTLTNVGKAIPDNAEWPSGVDSVEEGIESIDAAYHMNHRSGDIGHYLVESVGETEAEIRCTNPYPCAFDQGIIEGVAQEFGDGLPHLEEIGDECRESGGKECTYLLTW